jgi:hypothetical protein
MRSGKFSSKRDRDRFQDESALMLILAYAGVCALLASVKLVLLG